ncbi:MAG: FAD:protein FMN transferase, partial [Nevskiales bacterium]
LPIIGWEKVQWQRPRIALPIVGMELDFGGYVKEYAADSAARVCREQGVRHGFVELGGDISVIGPHPDGAAWQVGIQHPRRPQEPIATIKLSEGGIASSGDYERYFELNGKRYCHILNPLTGWPAEGLQAVSVAAAQCLVAGTASTVAMLKGSDEGPRWLESLGLPFLLVESHGAVRQNGLV